MRSCWMVFFLVVWGIGGWAQKPALDTTTMKRWVSLGHFEVSRGGSYELYSLQGEGKNMLWVRSLTNSWQRAIPGVATGTFSAGGAYVYFLGGHDSLGILSLDHDSIHYVSGVRSYQHAGEWLAYQALDKSCHLLQVRSGEEKILESMELYVFTSSEQGLLVLCRDSVEGETVRWVDLRHGSDRVIWQGHKLIRWTIRDGQVALLVQGEGMSRGCDVYYFHNGLRRAALVATSWEANRDYGLEIGDRQLEFNREGSRLFFKLAEKEIVAHPTGVPVDIWHYADKKLQTAQDLHPGQYMAVISLVGATDTTVAPDRIVRLEQDGETVVGQPQTSTGDYIVCMDAKGYSTVEIWENTAAWPNTYVVSLVNGTRRLLRQQQRYLNWNIPPSPSGQYFIFFDPHANAYFSYEVVTGICRNITRSIPVRLNNTTIDEAPQVTTRAVGTGGWWQPDSTILIYDNYDIWKVDPAGRRQPINFTRGYGARHHLRFRLCEDGVTKTPIIRGEKLLLRAFNVTTKYSGYYELDTSGDKDPVLLTMGPYQWDQEWKVQDTKEWVVRRMSATESPNYYSTTDFKAFQPLTTNYPERGYNWLTAELIRWKALDGRRIEGILYKPENFDPKKKYPMIVTSYDKMTDKLYEFHGSGVSDGNINIAYFVSQGYLVFTPDIWFTPGHTGQSAVNAIVAGVNYLKQYPWVDGRRIGVQGASFGGFHVNYLVTHTHLFAAAVECCGMTDIISAYGDLMVRDPAETWVELGQFRMGATLWERPDLYIENSPVLRADQVTTPLLMMNNKQDVGTPFRQGLELYMALRRLKKPVWLLQYDEGGHGVGGRSALDFTIRLTQFYDYYLKGKLPPVWMTKGVPARWKGIRTGYELDTSGQRP